MALPNQLKKIYTFNTLAPAILGAQIKNAKLLGMLDYTSALAYDNVDLKFRQVYPALPAGTPNQPASCIYYWFQGESGDKIIIADAWIDATSVEVVEHINIQVNFTDASLADIARIRDALNALGFRNYVINQT
jgi:hypothetical protein